MKAFYLLAAVSALVADSESSRGDCAYAKSDDCAIGLIKKNCICIAEWDPLCGCDGEKSQMGVPWRAMVLWQWGLRAYPMTWSVIRSRK